MSKTEELLKVILGDTYRALLPEGTTSEFQRILELKGLKKTEHQSILDDFNKHAPAVIMQPSLAVPLVVPASPSAPPTHAAVSNQASVGAIASREDVLTRTAALGKDSYTTGFKRFLALTEAAKDRKDGPLRKLFSP